MDALRTEKISVNLTPDLAARLDQFAAANHWTRSTAAVVLIERGLTNERQEDHQQ
jgi:predicted transcriptional regulator